MLLTRNQFMAHMAAQGIEIEKGAPLWAYEVTCGRQSSWFVMLRVSGLLDTIRELTPLGAVCYSAEGLGEDGLMESWWGVTDRSVAMELWLRWG